MKIGNEFFVTSETGNATEKESVKGRYMNESANGTSVKWTETTEMDWNVNVGTCSTCNKYHNNIDTPFLPSTPKVFLPGNLHVNISLDHIIIISSHDLIHHLITTMLCIIITVKRDLEVPTSTRHLPCRLVVLDLCVAHVALANTRKDALTIWLISIPQK